MTKSFEVKVKVERGTITGRNGTFDIKELSVWGLMAPGGFAYIEGIGKRGAVIIGGFYVPLTALLNLCKGIVAKTCEHACSKCGQWFSVHNADGSCVEPPRTKIRNLTIEEAKRIRQFAIEVVMHEGFVNDDFRRQMSEVWVDGLAIDEQIDAICPRKKIVNVLGFDPFKAEEDV